MKINTRQGKSYAVTSAAGASVTNENGVVLLAAEPGVQGVFVATGMYVEVDDEAAQVTEISSGGGAGSGGGGGGGGSAVAGKSAYELAQEAGFSGSVSEWLASLKGEPGEPGRDGAPGAPGPQGEPGSVDPEELQAAVSKAVAEQPEPIVLGEGADDNLNARSIELSEVHAPAGFEVAAVRLLARSGQSVSGAAVYLSAWEQVSGDNYRLLGVSTDAQAQVLEEWTEWHFEGLALGGKRVRWAALAAPDTPFGEASELYLRVKAREGDDSCVIHTSSAPFNYHPAMEIKSVARDKFAPMSHVGDSSHITAEERVKWDGAAQQADAAKTAAAAAQNAANAADNNAMFAWSMATAAQAAADEAKRLAENGGGGGVGFEDTGNITGGTATNYSTATGKSAQAKGAESTATGSSALANGEYSTATGGGAQADGLNSTVTGYNALANGEYSTATGSGAQAKGAESTATGSSALANGEYSTATGSGAQADGLNSTVTGHRSQATGSYSTATGAYAHATNVGSFAYGSYAQTDKAGEGVLRVATQSANQDTYATALKLVGAGSEVSTASLGGACGLGYKEKTADWRYVKLKSIFDLADRAEALLALLGG